MNPAISVNEDLLLFYEKDQRPVFRIYEPPNVSVVLGAGRNEKELFLDRMAEDNIPLFKRKGGGGTVVLSPGQMVFVLVKRVDSVFHSSAYVSETNALVVEALCCLSVSGVEETGISDLAIGGRKILGSSIFRRKDIFFFQASLLVSNDISLFARYLQIPRIAPEYRAGRSHQQFCTNLHLQGCRISVAEIKKELTRVLLEKIPEIRADPVS